MQKIFFLAAAISLAALSNTALAGDTAAGQAGYGMCIGCHGPTGAGNVAMQYPKLAGLKTPIIWLSS